MTSLPDYTLARDAARAPTVGPDPSHTDIELMLRAWHSGPAGRDVALLMADQNRENARSDRT